MSPQAGASHDQRFTIRHRPFMDGLPTMPKASSENFRLSGNQLQLLTAEGKQPRELRWEYDLGNVDAVDRHVQGQESPL